MEVWNSSLLWYSEQLTNSPTQYTEIFFIEVSEKLAVVGEVTSDRGLVLLMLFQGGEHMQCSCVVADHLSACGIT